MSCRPPCRRCGRTRPRAGNWALDALRRRWYYRALMSFHVARLSLVVLTSLALFSGASSAQEYKFPYRDPYLATITTAVLNADGHTPSAKRQVVHVPALPGRNGLPTLEARWNLSVARHSQRGPAPLLVIVSRI